MVDILYSDWANLLLRWAHMTVGIAWIGTSFFFVWLDMSLRTYRALPDGVKGESWMVHGGGFYLAQKFMVAPPDLPRELHWFKYEAYFTWVTGILLLVVVYYLNAEAFLIDTSVHAYTPRQAVFVSLVCLVAGYAIYEGLCRSAIGRRTGLLALALMVLTIAAAWLFLQVFSGRAAFIHVGVLLGTIMAGNVFVVIMPNQRKTVAAMTAGRQPDPAWGAEARQRSLHNNYLTLPVLLMMISHHFPILYGHAQAWLTVALILVGSGLVRHYLNVVDAGIQSRWTRWFLPGAAVTLVALVLFTSYRPGTETDGDAAAVDPRAVWRVVQVHCSACHGRHPIDPAFAAAPAGIMFDTPAEVERHAGAIHAQAGIAATMPPGNPTGMDDTDRALLRAWFEGGGLLPLD